MWRFFYSRITEHLYRQNIISITCFKKTNNPLFIFGKTKMLKAQITWSVNNFSFFFSIAKFEFKVALHYGPWKTPSCDPLMLWGVLCPPHRKPIKITLGFPQGFKVGPLYKNVASYEKHITCIFFNASSSSYNVMKALKENCQIMNACLSLSHTLSPLSYVTLQSLLTLRIKCKVITHNWYWSLLIF